MRNREKERAHTCSSHANRDARARTHTHTHTLQGTTALHVASHHGHINCIKLLLQNGANINARDDASSSTPLLKALERTHEDAALFLLQNGADFMRGDAESTLPLHMAAASCSVSLVDKLVRIMGERKRDPKVGCVCVCLCVFLPSLV